MTRRDVGKLCIFPPQKTLRENAQPYRFWGLLGFPPRSESINGLSFHALFQGGHQFNILADQQPG
jgi:hypothetical protein